VVRITQLIMNNTPSRILRNLSLLTVFTGHKPSSPLDVMFAPEVLTASESADKLHPRWEEPAQVMEVINPCRFKVRNLVTEEITEWHAECLKRYADRDLKVTEQLKEFCGSWRPWIRCVCYPGSSMGSHC
jgi:hypothetical protein